MVILGIETSCDETAAAIIKKDERRITLLSTIISSSLLLHQPTGGIIPENAAREQVKYILPVIQEALEKAAVTLEDIDAIAITYGPGLIGSLLVGVEMAKTLAFVLNKPIIPINHMVGHIYANFICHPEQNEGSYKKTQDSSPSAQNDITFPALALVVSGGHTDLLLMKNHGDFTLLGGTRDDAAGEAFDKIGRLLGLDYPAGPTIEKLAKQGDPRLAEDGESRRAKRFRFPRPLIGSPDYDFSFSGLKTAVLREVLKLKEQTHRHSGLSRIDSGVAEAPQNDLDEQTIADICRATQDAITDVLVKKTLKAAKEYSVKSILLSGGVAANQTLRDSFEQKIKDQQLSTTLFAPTKSLCTDNAAMIAAAAAYNFHPVPWQEITANPELYFD